MEVTKTIIIRRAIDLKFHQKIRNKNNISKERLEILQKMLRKHT